MYKSNEEMVTRKVFFKCVSRPTGVRNPHTEYQYPCSCLISFNPDIIPFLSVNPTTQGMLYRGVGVMIILCGTII